MAPAHGAALPVTPNKNILGNVAIEKVIQKLNDDYGLGIEIPDPTLSPSRRKQLGEENEQYARWNHICRGIRFLYYQRGDSLDQALNNFFNEAKAASLRWVPKPRADPGTLPSVRRPPKAQTEGQQWNLQSILIDVIDSVMAQTRPPLLLPRLNTNSVSGPSVPSTTLHPARSEESDAGSSGSPASARSKRSFDGEYDYGAKRPRGKEPRVPPIPSPTSTALAHALDNVPTRRRLGRPLEDGLPEPRQQDEERDSSSDTSGSSRVSSLFSHRDGQQLTQNTLDGDYREEKRPLAAAAPPYRSSPRFSVAHRTPPAVNQVSAQAHAAPGLTDAGQQFPPQSSGVTTVYSEISSSGAFLLDDVLEQLTWDRTEPPASGEPTALQRRLRNIWRKWKPRGSMQPLSDSLQPSSPAGSMTPPSPLRGKSPGSATIAKSTSKTTS